MKPKVANKRPESSFGGNFGTQSGGERTNLPAEGGLVEELSAVIGLPWAYPPNPP